MNVVEEVFGVQKAIIGVVHLPRFPALRAMRVRS